MPGKIVGQNPGSGARPPSAAGRLFTRPMCLTVAVRIQESEPAGGVRENDSLSTPDVNKSSRKGRNTSGLFSIAQKTINKEKAPKPPSKCAKSCLADVVPCHEGGIRDLPRRDESIRFFRISFWSLSAFGVGPLGSQPMVLWAKTVRHFLASRAGSSRELSIVFHATVLHS